MTNTTTEKLGTKRPLTYQRVHLRIRKGSLQSRHASRESTTVRLYQPTSANEQKRIRPTRPHHLVENVEALIVDNFIHAIEETKIIRPRSCQAVRLLRASGKALGGVERGKRCMVSVLLLYARKMHRRVRKGPPGFICTPQRSLLEAEFMPSQRQEMVEVEHSTDRATKIYYPGL